MGDNDRGAHHAAARPRQLCVAKLRSVLHEPKDVILPAPPPPHSIALCVSFLCTASFVTYEQFSSIADAVNLDCPCQRTSWAASSLGTLSLSNANILIGSLCASPPSNPPTCIRNLFSAFFTVHP